MATSPIDYFTAVYGTPPWTNLELTWDGTGEEYTLFLVGNDISLVNGTAKSHTFVGMPDTRYDFLLQTATVTGGRALTISAYTAPLPPPSGLEAPATTDDSITLSWLPIDGAAYEIADVANSYAIIDTTAATSVTIASLAANTRYSYAIRTVFEGVRSKWSRPITATTGIGATVTPGVYTFSPVTAGVWIAGRAGSSVPGWRPSSDDYQHGDGWAWGETSGVQSTYFFYGAPNPFLPILGGDFTKFEVYLARTIDSGDPGAVLSHWFLHGYSSKPTGEPTANDSVADAGLFTRAQEGWVELPTSWAYSLTENGTQKGLGWGGVDGRFQVAPSTEPLTGTLRITVG